MGITGKQRGQVVLPGLGVWKDVPFDPANFTGVGGMTWSLTPPLITNRYCLMGNTVIWNHWSSGTVGGTLGNSLYIVPPIPYKVAKYSTATCIIIQSSNNALGRASVNASLAGATGMIGISLVPVANFVAGSVQVQFSLMYEYGDGIPL